MAKDEQKQQSALPQDPPQDPPPPPAPVLAKGGPISVAGVLGGSFQVKGVGFGDRGTLTLNGAPLQITKWSDTDIRGQIPANAKHGVVEILTPTTVFRGSWK